MQSPEWPRFQKLQIRQPSLPNPSSRVAGHREQMGKQATEFHHADAHGEPIEASCILSNAIEVSGIGNLWLDGRLADLDTHMTSYWRAAIASKKVDTEQESKLPTREIDEICICALGWGNNVYGHVLIDLLPRILLSDLWAAERGLGASKILLPDSSPNWLIPLLGHFGISPNRVIKFSPAKEKVRLTRGVFPSYMYRSNGFHPITADLIDKNWSVPLEKTTRDGIVYLSRLGIKREGARYCENEAELIEIARAEFGCTVLQPETLTLREQVEIFNNAFGVVGLYGSGLHTALLTDADLRVGVIGMINLAQSHIASLRRQPISYFNEGIHVTGSFEVDADLFRWFMRGQIAPLKAHRERVAAMRLK